MVIYQKLDDILSMPTAHAAGMKKVLSKGNIDLTRLTQIAWGSLKPEEEIPEHCHADMEEYFFFTHGLGKMIVDGYEYSLSAGVFIKLPAGAKHFLTCAGEGLKFFYFGLQVY